ncbi:ABC transporter substrate-binding protein [Sphaerotilaceae bacterium SBD11-9]
MLNRRSLLLAAPSLVGGASFSAFPSLAAAAAAPPPAGTLRFGQSASLSGGQAEYGRGVRDGIVAAFAAAPLRHPGSPRFELVSLDDGGDKERCKQNAKALIEGGCSGLIGFTSGAAAEASLSLIEEAQMPLVGTASGNMGIRSSQLTMQYHVRAGYDTEFKRMVAYVKDFGMRRVGYVYLKDTSAANLGAMTAALESVGVKLTESVGLDRNATSFQAEAARLLAARLDCVLFTTNAAPITGIVDHMVAGQYRGLYFSSSFAGQALIDAMAQKGQSVIMTQVVPRPNAMGLSVVSRAKQDLAALGTGTRMGFTALEGYVAGLVAVEAARNGMRRDGTLPKARLREALAGLRTDLGGYKVDFASGSSQGSNFVEVVAVDRHGRIIG